MATPTQLRMARAALEWTLRETADRAGVAFTTVNRIERGHASPNRATMAAIQRALESAGIEFLDGDGVRVRPTAEASP